MEGVFVTNLGRFGKLVHARDKSRVFWVARIARGEAKRRLVEVLGTTSGMPRMQDCGRHPTHAHAMREIRRMLDEE